MVKFFVNVMGHTKIDLQHLQSGPNDRTRVMFCYHKPKTICLERNKEAQLSGWVKNLRQA